MIGLKRGTNMNDLDFIRKHVREWPEGANGVRVDYDGEIRFRTKYRDYCRYDFYPEYGTTIEGSGRCYSEFDLFGWTIFNNTLPLKQLDAHQRGGLFNHWRINKTESMTFLYSGEYINVRNVLWVEDTVYRAKPIVALTERQLFTKEAKHYESVEDMFDSGKFKLVDEIPEKKYTFTNKVVHLNIV